MSKKKSSAASKEKSPFGEYTIAQIMSSEKDAFVIQVGRDLFDESGRLVFTENAAKIYLHRIKENLLDVIEGGDAEEREEALADLSTLKMMPLRIN